MIRTATARRQRLAMRMHNLKIARPLANLQPKQVRKKHATNTISIGLMSFVVHACIPGRRGLSIQSLSPLAYWVARSWGERKRCRPSNGYAGDNDRVISGGRNFAIPRREAPGLCLKPCPSGEQRAQGKPGADCTHGSRATKSTGVGPQVQPESLRPSPRNGLRLIPRSPQ